MRLRKDQGLLGSSLWWGAFLAATFILSLCFQAFKEFTLTPDVFHGLLLLGALLLLLGVMLLLVIDGYLKERQKGNIQRPVALFEWIYQACDKEGEARR